jgi:hypothetical protein
MKPFLAIFIMLSLRSMAQSSVDSLSQILLQKEQQLMDGLASGDKVLWGAALHDSCSIAVEDGSYMTKEKFLDELNPLPASYKGYIKILEPKVKAFGSTAVLTFIDDEYLELYGQKIHTQYRQSDTWMNVNGDWKMISMQIFEIPKNPPAIHVSEKVLSQYVGVYEVGADRKCTVTLENGKLYSKKGSKNPAELLPETENVFFRGGDGRVRILFVKDSSDGKFKMIERRAGEDVVWKRK